MKNEANESCTENQTKLNLSKDTTLLDKGHSRFQCLRHVTPYHHNGQTSP